MPLDNEIRRELQRLKNRQLDFNPEIKTAAPDTDTDKKGVDNAHVYLSADTDYHLVVRIKGVPYRVALTSEF